MIRTLALLGLAATMAAPQASLAQAPSGYGTTGPNGQPLPPEQATSTWARYWNYNNEALYRAEQGSEWVRTHGQGHPPGY